MIGYGAHGTSSLEHSEAGVMSGIATRCLVQPFDVLKIRFQVSESSSTARAASLATMHGGGPYRGWAVVASMRFVMCAFQMQREPTFGVTKGRYRGVVQACSRIYRDEGLHAFWKGHVPAQGLSAVYGLVQFAAFEWLTEQATRFPGMLSFSSFSNLPSGTLTQPVNPVPLAALATARRLSGD
ncbi:unnamed protein product [Gongylonema pulchrum]|uniref:ADP/ATP translocase n=1 Tax=Gongylonema pulchrum TaxID=637853 RepID=A0A183DU12_9BILA|nr:unnamed protein product [Gongylonema pulchrum]